MKFGIMIDSHVGKADVVAEAEKLGYHRAWFCDSQMVWSDPYVVMTQAAERTKHILIGTGVTGPSGRLAPITANAIATINALAPGRTFLGIATGHTSMRMIGQPPATIAAYGDYVRVVRKLLAGEAVEYTHAGRTAEIQFDHQDRGYLNLKDPIPIYLGANGPRALALVGEQGDGWIAAALTVDDVKRDIGRIGDAAKQVGRALPKDFVACNTITACVLRPGEKLTDRRVIDQVGSMVTAALHFSYEIWHDAGRPDALIPPHFANVWDAYVARVANFSLPPAARFREIHQGHATYLIEEERALVTPEAIRAVCVVGPAEEIVQKLRGLEAAGATEIALMPPADFQRDVFRDFAQHVMPHFR